MLRVAIESGPSPILVLDHAERVVACSRTARAMLGLTGDPTGKPLAEVGFRLLASDPSAAVLEQVEASGSIKVTACSCLSLEIGDGGSGTLVSLARQPSFDESETEGLFGLFMRSNVVGVVLGRVDGTVIKANDAFLEMLGLQQSDMPIDWRAYTPDEIQRADDAFFRTLMMRGAAKPYQRSMRSKQGHLVPMLGGGALVNAERGEFLGILIDLSEQKAAEAALRQLSTVLDQQVRERTDQLEATNHELKSFSYSVSHDLRGPLRSIQGFSTILLEDYGSKFDAEARDMLERIVAAVGRMSSLLDGLLRLSRVSQADLTIETIDLSEVAREATAVLAQRDPSRHVRFDIQPGLVVVGDRVLLRLALENLIENAWKFTARRPDAVIQVRSEEREGRQWLIVEDNGVGFPNTAGDRLFRPFERLHAERDFPGSGIGLATVRRIALRHGGEVRAVSVEGEGATFSIGFPLQNLPPR